MRTSDDDAASSGDSASAEASAHVWGPRYGKHSWRRGATAAVGSAPASRKFTIFRCAACEYQFRHYYDLVPCLQQAMARKKVPKACAEASDESSDMALSADDDEGDGSEEEEEEEEEDTTHASDRFPGVDISALLEASENSATASHDSDTE